MNLRDLNPFAPLPSVAVLVSEELEELRRALYLADKQADHHRAYATALQQRIAKLERPTNGS